MFVPRHIKRGKKKKQLKKRISGCERARTDSGDLLNLFARTDRDLAVELLHHARDDHLEISILEPANAATTTANTSSYQLIEHRSHVTSELLCSVIIKTSTAVIRDNSQGSLNGNEKP